MTPVSILQVLATAPDGKQDRALSLQELTQYLQKNLNTEYETARNRRHANRDEMYRDGGEAFMHAVIDKVFTDDQVRELRKKFVEFARFNNALKRIVNELSTVYAEPAVRSVTGVAANAKYTELLDGLLFDEVMLQVSRLLNLHRALLVGFRVRELPDGTLEPTIDVVTPADARVLLHPNDNKLPIAWLVRASHKPGRELVDALDMPAWTLWSAFETMKLRDDLSAIASTYRPHKLGVSPFVPVTLGPPAANFWPGEEGEDLVAAHVSIWLVNVLLLKETKSATKQTMLKGDGTNTARQQAADTEVPAELADGQSASTVDMSMDLNLFRATADHILEHCAQNYGMSPSLITHQGVQSAEARELMRMPLREIRKHQQVPLRRFERDFAVVMSKILAKDMPGAEFAVDGWRIVFGEFSTPMSKIDELNVFLAARQAGVDDTIGFIKRTTGKDDDEAEAEMRAHIIVETLRNRLMRPMEAMAGGMAQNVPDPNAPAGQGLDAPGAKVDKLGDAQPPGNPTFVSPAFNSGPVPEKRPTSGGSGGSAATKG